MAGKPSTHSAASGVGCSYVNSQTVLRVLSCMMILHLLDKTRRAGAQFRSCHHTREVYVRSDLLCEHQAVFAFTLAGAPPVRDTTCKMKEQTGGRKTLQLPERSFLNRIQNYTTGGRCGCWCCGVGAVVVCFATCFPALSSFHPASRFDSTMIFASFVSPFAFFFFPLPSRLVQFFYSLRLPALVPKEND